MGREVRTFRWFEVRWLDVLWRVFQCIQDALRRLQPRTASLSILLATLWRMRFALCFGLAGTLLLTTPQGKEILATSLSTITEGLCFAVTCMLAAFSVWYASRFLFETWTPEQHPAATASGMAAWLRHWIPCVLGTLVVGIPGVQIFGMHSILGPNSVAYVVSTVLCVLAVVFLALTSTRRAGITARAATGRIADLDAPMRVFISAMMLLNLLTLLVLWVFPSVFQRAVGGAGLAMMFAIALVIVVGSVLVHLADSTRTPLFTAGFAAMALFSCWNDNHTIPVAASPLADAARAKDLETYLRNRIDPLLERACASKDAHDCTAKVPVIVVAAEGGGVRAAAWTAAVLARIDQALPGDADSIGFADSMLGVSGVSGGSLGTAVYLAARASTQGRGMSPAQVAQATLERSDRYFADSDLMSPMLTSMLFTDNAQRFLPFAIPSHLVDDRGRTFERTLTRAWSDSGTGDDVNAFAEPFEALWSGGNARLPLLIANTTVVATGERMVQAPLPLHGPRLGRPFASALDAARCWKTGGVTLAGAVHNSARFTWVSPAGRYDTRSSCSGVRVVDGGYFENSGAATASDLLAAVVSLYPDRVRPILVQIRNEPIPPGSARRGCSSRVSETSAAADDGSPPSDILYPLMDFGDPLRALLKGREARGAQALNALRRRLCDTGWSGDYMEFALVRNADAQFPLHWTIAAHTLNAMKHQFDDPAGGNRQALEDLRLVLSSPITDAAAAPATFVNAPVAASHTAAWMVPPATTRTDADAQPDMPSQTPAAAQAPSPTKHQEARAQTLRNLESVLAFSNSMRDLCIAALGGTVVLVLGSSLRRPQGLRARAGFLWLLPGWVALSSALQKWAEVHQHHLALVLSPKADPLTILERVNNAIQVQITHTSIAMAFIGAWLMLYLVWWVFHRQPEETPP